MTASFIHNQGIEAKQFLEHMFYFTPAFSSTVKVIYLKVSSALPLRGMLRLGQNVFLHHPGMQLEGHVSFRAGIWLELGTPAEYSDSAAEEHWYNPSMADIFIIQLIGVVLALTGFIALTASAGLFGYPLSPADRRRASDEWNRRRDTTRLPINLETIVSTAFLLGGIGILIWSRFELCSFLGYWFPPLPELARSVLSCR